MAIGLVVIGPVVMVDGTPLLDLVAMVELLKRGVDELFKVSILVAEELLVHWLWARH